MCVGVVVLVKACPVREPKTQSKPELCLYPEYLAAVLMILLSRGGPVEIAEHAA